MKKAVLMTAMLMLSAFTFAQQQLATLNHNNNITAYYGLNALSSAYNAAEDGDIITLSSGVFNATDINKNLTIRGAGAWADTTGGSTMIRNNFAIGAGGDVDQHVTLEGIYFYNSVYCRNVSYHQFTKCHFQWIGVDNAWSSMSNASFVNCILAYWGNKGGDYYYGYVSAQGIQFINSVVLNSNIYNTNDVYINCIVKQNPSQTTSRMFENCVLYWDYADSVTTADNSSTSFNCLYVQTDTNSIYTDVLFSPLTGHQLWNVRGMDNVFQTFNGSTEGEDYKLLDSVTNTYLGTDGTEIGIYGGIMPFNPHVTSPLIKRITVANRSNANGQLPIDIEIANE